MDIVRYKQFDLHEKINIRSCLSSYKHLSAIAKKHKDKYFRAKRPYLNYPFNGASYPHRIPDNASKDEKFEFKF